MRAALLALLLAGPAWAAETAAFLDVGVGARAWGMGGAQTALAQDAHAIYWNPAGLAGVEKRDAALSHAELAGGAKHEFLAFARKAEAGTFGLGVTYLGHPEFDGRDSSGRGTGSISASESAIALAFARKTEWADAGVSLKHVRGSIGSANADGVAADLGLRRAFGAWTAAAALRNLGAGLKYDAQRNDLPLRAAFGAAYALEGGHRLAAELNHGPRGTGTDGGVGVEYQAIKAVFLRAGWTSRSMVSGGAGFDAARGLTLGLGLAHARWTLDYAAAPTGELGSAHRFSVGARW